MTSRLAWLRRAGVRRLLRPSSLPWWVLVAGLLSTLLAATAQQRFSLQEHQRLERVLAEDINAALTSRLATNEAILAAVVGLFDASEDVTETEFARFDRALTLNNANLAGIQGVGFTARILPEQLAAFEQRIRSQGQPDFHVRPPGRRSLMTAIVFLQPADWRNQRAMGYDMASQATRRQAMERAAYSGEPVLSGPVRLQQETEDQPQVGTLLYTSIYSGEEPFRSPYDRWRRLRGWAYMPMRMGDLVASALNTVSNPDRNDSAVLLFDGERPLPQRLLHDSHGLLSDASRPGDAAGPDAAQRLESISWVPLQLANRRWLLGVQLGHRHHGLVSGSGDLVRTSILGLSLSLLASLLTARLVANHLALRQGLERESQAARERALAAAVFDSSPVGVVVTDPNGIISERHHPAGQSGVHPDQRLLRA